MKLWIVYFESANYCGYGAHCLVRAETEDQARTLAEGYAEDFYYDQDQDQYYEEHPENMDVGPDSWADIKTVEVLDENHESWIFVQMPSQASIYPMIN